MLCRNKARAEAARDDVVAQSGNDKVVFLQADVSLEADVRRVVDELTFHPLARVAKDSQPRLDGLVCNAGALLNELTMTKEGFETTFAAHLLFGTYLLGDLCMPLLNATADSRLVIVSSGGMYNYGLPSWEVLTSTNESSEKNYDGQKAYAYAKRGQVILAEYWTKEHPEVKIVTAHPGWTLSEGPMRTAWEGAEGICWLLTVAANKIQGGEFYLDREPQPKHIAGSFWFEGSATKNTVEEKDLFRMNLTRWGAADATGAHTQLWRPTLERTQAKLAARSVSVRVSASSTPIDLASFMIRWHVLAHMPILSVNEHKLCNPYEHYTYNESHEMIKVNFTSTPLDSQVSQLAQMHAYVKDKTTNTRWSLNPKLLIYLPLRLDYILIHVAEDYSWCLVGVPARDYLWIMTKKRPRVKDPLPWPSDVEPVFQGTGNDYSDDRGTTMTKSEELSVLEQGLSIAEQNGYDISQVRIAGWRADIP
eukprot:GSChrysophyteH1.ASY1.ANO1.2403.1 assembled CDS